MDEASILRRHLHNVSRFYWWLSVTGRDRAAEDLRADPSSTCRRRRRNARASARRCGAAATLGARTAFHRPAVPVVPSFQRDLQLSIARGWRCPAVQTSPVCSAGSSPQKRHGGRPLWGHRSGPRRACVVAVPNQQALCTYIGLLAGFSTRMPSCGRSRHCARAIKCFRIDEF